MIHNLSTKNISEFTAGDTLYIKRGSPQSNTFLCQFVKYEKGNVTGKVIEATTNPELYRHEIERGWEITAKLSSCALYGADPHKPKRGYYHWFNSMGQALGPEEVFKITESGMHVEQHPSFGLAQFSRITGGVGTMFGSSIQHNEKIQLTVTTASHKRDLHHDWFHAEKTLLQLQMSPTQFAELLTNMSRGEGVPVTLSYVNGKHIGEPPCVSKLAMFADEFKNSMHNFDVDMQAAKAKVFAVLEKPAINKGDRRVIADAFNALTSHVKNNLPFINDQFREQMEKTVVEAKGEIESFYNRMIHESGLAAIAAQVPTPHMLKESTNDIPSVPPEDRNKEKI